MKKIDSNSYGGKVIGIGIVLAAVIPICLKLINRMLHSSVVTILMWCFVVAGSLILAGFFIYLGIECKQDSKVSQYYDTHRNVKLPIDYSYYECGNCGNRKVKKEDTSCLVCGARFSKDSDKSVQEVLNGK